jgi:imidazolonepropionase-like amidohydrolase
VDAEAAVALTGATVIDGNGSSPLRDGVVVVDKERIVYVGPASGVRLGRRVKISHLKGKWIVPGFVDTHGHLPGPEGVASFLAQLVAFGTTTLRAPANPRVELRELGAKGQLVGPQLSVAGTLIDGVDSVYNWAVRVSTEAEIRDVVKRQAGERVDFIKLYVGLPPNLVRAAVEEAHRHGLRVIGHLGKTTWAEAAEIGIDSLAHSWYSGLAHCVVPSQFRSEFRDFYVPNPRFDAGLFKKWREIVQPDSGEVLALADKLRERHVEVHPNLVLGEAMTWGDDPAVLERLEPSFAAPEIAAGWRRDRHPYSAGWSAGDRAEAKRAFPSMAAMIRIFHGRGVLLTAGTDYQNPWMTPGVAFHRELELLAAAGIPPLDVIRIATRNGAEALGIGKEAGTIEQGKRADLVVLSADPLASISHTRKVERVFLRGRMFDPRLLLLPR